MDIRTISVSSPLGQEAQTDYRGTNAPDSILIALADGRIVTISHNEDGRDHIVVHGPDMETLLDIPLPGDISGLLAALPGYTEAEARLAFGDR